MNKQHMRNFGIRLPNDLLERVEAVSAHYQVPMSYIVRKGLIKEIDRLEDEVEKSKQPIADSLQVTG